MKHLKIYESFTIYNNDVRKYKVGDYVLISGQLFMSGKDIPVKIKSELFFKNSDSNDIIHDDGTINYTEYKYIIRYLTPEEKEKFEISINTKKYNL